MSDTITADELALIATLKALPKLPIVVARDMLVAQTVKFTAEELRTIKARQQVFLQLGCPGRVSIRVEDHHGARIGEIVFPA